MIGGNGRCFANCAACKPVSSQQQHVCISGAHLDALHGLRGLLGELRVAHFPRLRLQLLRLLEPRLSAYTCAHRVSAQRTPGATLHRHAYALRAELPQQTCCLLCHQCSTAGTCCRCSSSSKALIRGSAAPVAVAAAEGKSAEAPRLWNPGPPAIPTSPVKHGNDTCSQDIAAGKHQCPNRWLTYLDQGTTGSWAPPSCHLLALGPGRC